jgi:ABC-2 type transport system permease protein/capsular polysaccharide transport system permease protein
MIRSARAFLASWQVEQRVVFALLMREIMTRFGRHNLGFLWLFVEPMIFTLGVAALWTAAQSLHGSSLPIVPFAVTGYSSVLLWRNMPTRCINAVDPNRTLLYHRNVKVVDIYFARLILEASGATISFMALTLFFWAIDWMQAPEDVLMIIQAWILLALFGAGFAIFLGALSEEFELVEKLWHPASYLLFPLSGAAYLVSSLPQDVQPLALYLPMVNGVEMLREGYFGSKVRAIYDVQYLIFSILVLWLLALLQLRKISKRAIAG